MADTRTDELYRALQDKGYPDELCREIAYKHVNTDYTATRMLGHLYRPESHHPEKRAGARPGYDQQRVSGGFVTEIPELCQCWQSEALQQFRDFLI